MRGKLYSLIKERFPGYTEVQKRAIPIVGAGKNVLLIAPTGTGKTEAAMLPIFEKIIERGKKEGIQVLYLTPLRALNRDMLARMERWCRRLGISLGVRHGDTPQHERSLQARRPPEVLITTPETLNALLCAKKMGEALRNVRHVVVDEIHSLFDNKRGAQLSIALERLAQRADFQRIALSATVGNPEEVARFLVGKERECEIVNISIERKIEIKIEKPGAETSGGNEWKSEASFMFLDEEAAARVARLRELVGKKKTLVFVNTRSVGEALASRLLYLKAPIGIHHGSLSREVRLSAEEKFKKGELNALLATSSLELGIDIGDIEQVVQYLSPKQVSRLVQRVGRSGHTVEKIPKGIIIVGDSEDELECRAIENLRARGWLEKNRVEKNALDVIAHQLCGILIEKGEVSLETAHGIMKKAASYGISLEELEKIAEQLHSQRTLFYEKERKMLKRNLKTLLYYFSRLSTIPAEKKFPLRNAVSNSIIGGLDEKFVATLEKGVVFITKGLPWRVLDIGEEVIVEPSNEFSLAVPDWEGDEIPVPFEVAQEVERIRGGERGIHIECTAELIAIHAHFGSLINETLGRALSALLSAKFGSSVRVLSDPYRIFIQPPKPVNAESMKEMLLRISNLRGILEPAIKNSSLFRYKFVHVARAFGLLELDAEMPRRFIEHFEGSPVYREALRTVFTQYLDIEGCERILKEVREGKMKVKAENLHALSSLARKGINRVRAGELIAPIEPGSEILKGFKKHVLQKNVRFFCTYCKKYFYHILNDAPKKIFCIHCGSPMVAFSGELSCGRIRRAVEKKEELELSASLIEAYGKRAAIALSVYGIGPNTAVRILQKIHKEEDAFFLDLLEAQKLFIRTRRYWTL